MSEQNTGADLQFDRAVTESTPLAAPGTAQCTGCQTAIATEYYSINGHTVCERCRETMAAAAQTPLGAGPLLKAGALGLAAGIVGSIIYYGVIALLNLEIGIVAILIGYMVGYAVRKGAGGRGGRRFQVMAIALTYGAVALAYTPVIIKAALDEGNGGKASAPTTVYSQQPAPAPTTAVASESSQDPAPSQGAFVAIASALGLIAALPVIIVFGSLPSGLISGAIIFFGMRQAWVMTGVPLLRIEGPYRVGADSATASA
ncbi:MAG TPA: hypothetical protein VKB50_18430 [Vicinamibacterales bacterium]|nr:hypothetical protein [Vicinamibacterales bacterium]